MVTQIPERVNHSKLAFSAQFILSKIRLQLLPILALNDYFDIDKILAVREVSAAIINVSGRQRMLSQRVSLCALQLSIEQDAKRQEILRQKLQQTLTLMENSHLDLLHGELASISPEKPSPEIQKIYYDSPYNLDQKITEFIRSGRAIASENKTEIDRNDSHLQFLIHASETDLIEALDAVVMQYQKEKEKQDIEINLCQAKLYKESCTLTAVAQARSQELSQTLTELQNTQIQLIQAEKLSSLGQLVAGVAHEVNNPLGFILGNIECAQHYTDNLLKILKLYQNYYPQPAQEIRDLSEEVELDYLSEDLPTLLESMNLGAERIQEIVLSLRNFSRADEARPKAIDIHECIKSTLTILRYRFKHCRQDTTLQTIEKYDRLPPVECYPGQLNQALMNLISNAIDALEESENQPTLVIQTELIQANPNWIAIRITDNGIGMPEEVRKNLFKPFFTTKPVGKGTGLGLSICHQIIVDRHGGSLECRSQPGKGTEFSIQIPVQQAF